MATLRRIDHKHAKSDLPAGDDSPKVLYVEDDETNFDIAQSILGQGFDVDWASSSDQAIDKLGSRSYDLILMDIELSGSAMSGLDLTQELRSGRFDRTEQRLSELPIIIVTAYAAAYSENELLNLVQTQCFISQSNRRCWLSARRTSRFNSRSGTLPSQRLNRRDGHA